MVSKSVVTPWKLDSPRTYLLTNTNLIDPVEGRVHYGVHVRLAGGLVRGVAAGPVGGRGSEPVTVVDTTGKFLCPGLFDAHVHLCAVPGEQQWRDTREMDSVVAAHRQAFVCQTMLDRGFTTVRDCGGVGAALKNAIDEGVVQGPRLFIAGPFLSQTGGHGDMRSSWDPRDQCCATKAAKTHICDGVAECLKAARDNIRTGSDFIKIMGGGGVASPTDHINHTQFTAEEIRAVTTVARNSHTYVTSHAYTPESITQAINSGVTSIEHGNLIDEATAKLMAEKDVFLTPTLSAYAAMSKSAFMPEESLRKTNEVLARGLDSLKIAANAGVTMCYGSDLLGHLVEAQSGEFTIRAQVLDATSILQSATINPARMSGQADFLGQISPGFAADLLVLNENPLDDITILSHPDKHILAVVKGGRVCSTRWTKLGLDTRQASCFIE